MDKREKKQIKDFYNKNAKNPEMKFNKRGRRTEDIARAFRFFKKDNPSVVEIGCGNGREAEMVLRHTNDYLGIDVSQEMIKLAKKRAPKGRFWTCDVMECVFPKGADIVFAFASLIHLSREEVRELLSRIYKNLNPGGIVYLSLKHGKQYKIIKKDMRGKTVVYPYTPELIQELAGEYFRVVYTDFQERNGTKWFTIILQK